MSVFLCSPRHLSALVNAAKMIGGRHVLVVSSYIPNDAPARLSQPATKETDEEILFHLLLDENLASVGERYPETTGLESWTDRPDGYRFSRVPKAPGVVAALKLISCYEYQSCEHAGWAESAARRYCDALRDYLITSLPGYEDAEWSI